MISSSVWPLDPHESWTEKYSCSLGVSRHCFVPHPTTFSFTASPWLVLPTYRPGRNWLFAAIAAGTTPIATPTRDAPQARVTTPRVSIFFGPVGAFLLSIVTIFRLVVLGVISTEDSSPDRVRAVRTRAHRSPSAPRQSARSIAQPSPCAK